MLSNSHTRSYLSLRNYHSSHGNYRSAHGPEKSAAVSQPPPSIGGWFARRLSEIRQWHAKHRTMNELSELDDRDLRDIGLTRADLEIAARRDPWMYTWMH